MDKTKEQIQIDELIQRVELLESIITINSGFIIKNLTDIMNITDVIISKEEQQILLFLKEHIDKIENERLKRENKIIEKSL